MDPPMHAISGVKYKSSEKEYLGSFSPFAHFFRLAQHLRYLLDPPVLVKILFGQPDWPTVRGHPPRHHTYRNQRLGSGGRPRE